MKRFSSCLTCKQSCLDPYTLFPFTVSFYFNHEDLLFYFIYLRFLTRDGNVMSKTRLVVFWGSVKTPPSMTTRCQ